MLSPAIARLWNETGRHRIAVTFAAVKRLSNGRQKTNVPPEFFGARPLPKRTHQPTNIFRQRFFGKYLVKAQLTGARVFFRVSLSNLTGRAISPQSSKLDACSSQYPEMEWLYFIYLGFTLMPPRADLAGHLNSNRNHSAMPRHSRRRQTMAKKGECSHCEPHLCEPPSCPETESEVLP